MTLYSRLLAREFFQELYIFFQYDHLKMHNTVKLTNDESRQGAFIVISTIYITDAAQNEMKHYSFMVPVLHTIKTQSYNRQYRTRGKVKKIMALDNKWLFNNKMALELCLKVINQFEWLIFLLLRIIRHSNFQQ